MTPQEWIDMMRAQAEAIVTNRVLFLATTGTMAEMSVRIWEDGGLSKGGTIAYKEDYEVYIYKPPFPRAPNGRGKTGRKIKGQWAPSYIAAKATQDRADLPFELTGDLRLAWAGGVTPTPRERDPFFCFIDLPTNEAKKSEGLENQKGVFLDLTKEEEESHTRRLNDLLNQLLQ
jgi:hypothetical protein